DDDVEVFPAGQRRCVHPAILYPSAPWQAWPFRRAHPAATQKPRAARTCTCRAVGAEFAGGLHADHPTDQGETKMVATDVDTLSAQEHGIQLRRAVIAATVGTAIEWYDFFLYSVVTGLVFAKLFFPKSDPLVGTLQAFAVYAVGFVARP